MSLHIFGHADENTLQQMDNVLKVNGASAIGVLCADNHLGYSMPIGGVVASEEVVMPAGVGFDIGCGNMAVETNVPASAEDIPAIMDLIWDTLSFGIGQKNGEKAQHGVLEAIATDPNPRIRELASKAAAQLGTIGSGNHYVDLFEDRTSGNLWIGVHFGSRGFGHSIATGYLNLAAGQKWDAKFNDQMMAVPATFPLGSELAMEYLHAMRLAGEYAYAGREWVVKKVLDLMRLGDYNVLQTIHNHHNFAWFETHGDKLMLVTRKGATPAFPGQKGFVGGSMGDDAIIIEGVDSPESVQGLYSTIHGAGRAMSRTQAAGKTKRRRGWQCGQRDCDYSNTDPRAFSRGVGNSRPLCPKCQKGLLLESKWEEQTTPGLVNWPDTQAALKVLGIELRGGGADEAPQAYKRLPDVFDAQGDTIRLLHRLRPIGVAMAGRDTIDPYKD